jgi:hypothetical protein
VLLFPQFVFDLEAITVGVYQPKDEEAQIFHVELFLPDLLSLLQAGMVCMDQQWSCALMYSFI